MCACIPTFCSHIRHQRVVDDGTLGIWDLSKAGSLSERTSGKEERYFACNFDVTFHCSNFDVVVVVVIVIVVVLL